MLGKSRSFFDQLILTVHIILCGYRFFWEGGHGLLVNLIPDWCLFYRKKTIKVTMMPYRCTCCRSVVDRIAKFSTFFFNYFPFVNCDVKRENDRATKTKSNAKKT